MAPPKKAPEKKKSPFDKLSIIHTMNLLIGIRFFMASEEIKSQVISLQSLRTIPLEQRFGVLRLQGKSHQTMPTILKTMSPDQSAKMKDAHEEVRKKRLAQGETVEKCNRSTSGFRHEPKILAQFLLEIIGCPVDTETADARQIVQYC
jgi:hypothetical protein